MKMTLTCDRCGKVYQSYQCGKYNHFCSIECRRLGAKLMSMNITEEDRRRRSEQIVRVNKTINNTPEKIAKRRKVLLDVSGRRPPKHDFSNLSPNEAREARRQTHLKEGIATGYRKYFGRHEHRVVMERILGRPLRSDEVVHHVDGNKRNNDPSNLRLMTQSEHIALHLREGGGHL